LYFCLRFSLFKKKYKFCLAGPALPQKICSKCRKTKNQKSAVISLFENTIIEILQIDNEIKFLNISVYSLKAFDGSIPLSGEEGFMSHSPSDKQTGVLFCPCNIQTRFTLLLRFTSSILHLHVEVVADK